ncbi:MAG: hypothetical protein ACXADU_15645 [Promethearchaeota archaeon]
MYKFVGKLFILEPPRDWRWGISGDRVEGGDFVEGRVWDWLCGGSGLGLVG